MIKREGFDSWWANMKSFKAKCQMCKPYLDKLMAAKGKFDKAKN